MKTSVNSRITQIEIHGNQALYIVMKIVTKPNSYNMSTKLQGDGNTTINHSTIESNLERQLGDNAMLYYIINIQTIEAIS